MVVTDKTYWRKKNVLFLEIVMMSTTNVFRSRIGRVTTTNPSLLVKVMRMRMRGSELPLIKVRYLRSKGLDSKNVL